MSKSVRTKEVDHLFAAILSLETKEECYTFFEDVCTINELLSISQRFEVAKMLREGKTYLEISEGHQQLQSAELTDLLIMVMMVMIWY